MFFSSTTQLCCCTQKHVRTQFARCCSRRSLLTGTIRGMVKALHQVQKFLPADFAVTVVLLSCKLQKQLDCVGLSIRVIHAAVSPR